MAPWTLAPEFISGPTGRLFALHIHPQEGTAGCEEAILYLPPFAEEMNRARRMASLLGRRLAEQSLGFLALDPFGTGDSDGEFHQASWTTWCRDAATAVDWLKDRGYRRISFLGLRLGACLALHAAQQARQELGRIVLWQPVLKGETFVNQFLRIRVAAGMADGGGEKETIKGLRARLAANETLEVAGYALNSEMIAELDGLALTNLALPLGATGLAQPISWFEINRNPEADLTPASRNAIQTLRDADLPVEASTITGEPFWSIEEPTYVPELLSSTAALWKGSAP